jgi:hypothetical protein
MQLVFSRKLSDSRVGITETRTKVILCHLAFNGKIFLMTFKKSGILLQNDDFFFRETVPTYYLNFFLVDFYIQYHKNSDTFSLFDTYFNCFLLISK